MLEHYKSWSHMKKRAESFICDSLRGRITYFFTNYHDVHNVYGRTAVRLDGKELVRFAWIEQYRQENDISKLLKENPKVSFASVEEEEQYISERQKAAWDANCTYCESDFLGAMQAFFHLAIEDALVSENYIVRILAIIDRRTGKRTLKRIKDRGEFSDYPDWVQIFYKLRLSVDGI